MNTHNEDGGRLNGRYSQKNEIGGGLMKESLKGINMLSWLKECLCQKQ
jgi:hypothetical protein